MALRNYKYYTLILSKDVYRIDLLTKKKESLFCNIFSCALGV